MKKFYAIAAIAAVTIFAVSCEKENKKGNNGDEDVVTRTHRVKTMGDTWSEPYTFSYNADGTVASVVSKSDNRVFEYSGSKLTIKNNGEIEYTMTLNSDGFATKVENADHTWNITYDSKGYMIKGEKDGVQCTSQSIEDGLILYWTRYDKDNNFWRMKDATYLSKDNVCAIQTHYAEDLGFSRWAWEARLFGNTSTKLLESCRWHNFGDQMAEKTAVYTYEYDANGLVTKEIKYYGVWNETDTTGMEVDTETTFTWEAIK
ncbi:MAG: hypothetical protein ACI3ZS_00385 [Candidatus Cryptobacteroides sp.]